jgi:hypothetical protein
MTCHRIFNKLNTTDVTSGAGRAYMYSSGALSSPQILRGGGGVVLLMLSNYMSSCIKCHVVLDATIGWADTGI